MNAADNRKTAMTRLDALSKLAESLMPAFRDKFDFSNPDAKPNDFDRLAAMSFTAAEAMFRLQDAKLGEIEATFEKELAKETSDNAAAEAKRIAREAELQHERDMLAKREAANG